MDVEKKGEKITRITFVALLELRGLQIAQEPLAVGLPREG